MTVEARPDTVKNNTYLASNSSCEKLLKSKKWKAERWADPLVEASDLVIGMFQYYSVLVFKWEICMKSWTQTSLSSFCTYDRTQNSPVLIDQAWLIKDAHYMAIPVSFSSLKAA